MRFTGCEVEGRGASLYLPTAWRRAIAPRFEGVSLGKGHPFLHVARANRIRRGGSRYHPERLSEAGMVDLLGMFRRRPAKRSPPGFARARAREDITALGDRVGGMLANPGPDAPPIPRDGPRGT